ncbi:hypothetical protein [Streptomyces chartreusis]
MLVEAEAAGRTGLGFTYGSPATVTVIEHEQADLVVGHDVFDILTGRPARHRQMPCGWFHGDRVPIPCDGDEPRQRQGVSRHSRERPEPLTSR